MASPAPPRDPLVGMCDRLRRLFGKRGALQKRNVLQRGERKTRDAGTYYDKYSPKGAKHIRGVTDTGSDARCAPVLPDEFKAMEPDAQWTLLNTRISTCEQEIGLREAEARTHGVNRDIALARRGARPLSRQAAHHIRSNAAFFASLGNLLNAWEAARIAVEAQTAKACPDDPEIDRLVEGMRATMHSRVPGLRKNIQAAEQLRDELLKPRLDPVRKSLGFEYK